MTTMTPSECYCGAAMAAWQEEPIFPYHVKSIDFKCGERWSPERGFAQRCHSRELSIRQASASRLLDAAVATPDGAKCTSRLFETTAKTLAEIGFHISAQKLRDMAAVLEELDYELGRELQTESKTDAGKLEADDELVGRVLRKNSNVMFEFWHQADGAFCVRRDGGILNCSMQSYADAMRGAGIPDSEPDEEWPL